VTCTVKELASESESASDPTNVTCVRMMVDSCDASYPSAALGFTATSNSPVQTAQITPSGWRQADAETTTEAWLTTALELALLVLDGGFVVSFLPGLVEVGDAVGVVDGVATLGVRATVVGAATTGATATVTVLGAGVVVAEDTLMVVRVALVRAVAGAFTYWAADTVPGTCTAGATVGAAAAVTSSGEMSESPAPIDLTTVTWAWGADMFSSRRTTEAEPMAAIDSATASQPTAIPAT
jgi:hypothetical protein